MAGLPYVGSKISLISQSEIRYEGTLHEIDKEQQTVSLVNVRSFGTEGRRSDLFIKPKPTPFKLIVFRGQDIKDLNVQQPVPEGDSDFKDPAILAHEEAAAPAAGAAQPKSKSSAKKAAAANRKKKAQESQKGKPAASKPAGSKPPKLPEPKDPNIAVKAPSTTEDWASRTAGGRFHPTRLNHRWKADEKQSRRPATGSYASRAGGRGPSVSAIDAQIDIAETSAALEREKEKLLQQSNAVDEGPKYDPDNFFDNLGSSTTLRVAQAATAPVQARMRRQNEKALNRETFGTVPHHNRRPPNTRRYAHGNPPNQKYNYTRPMQGSHNNNRYGAHNRTGHHNYKRSQTQQTRGPRY
mmetsp:Transcript_39960/g.58746  ORF Transcript_39960/g.58746 Transcript_39960/m.58746 type:complete len:354 (-) Transcript_39960:234-1295(-)|eukprot:CAMPEP_0195511822 /NCGR_PEP_ID=MMETSP0794_2-20130614/4006_1 /TAXON_ID=515487 /ORGANISM="Stephanopyxis turris, Strain CCMP 815" /LENGTH=353 /DNA_ID=CAMNT_0040639487 /DNA_START=205 /DNA_END=1266 /DNA_ORIENTATION=+